MVSLVIIASDCWTVGAKWPTPNGVGAEGATSGVDTAKDIGAGVIDTDEEVANKGAFPKADSLGVGNITTGAGGVWDSVGETVEDRVLETTAVPGAAVPSIVVESDRAVLLLSMSNMISGDFVNMDGSFDSKKPIDSKDVASFESDTAADIVGVGITRLDEGKPDGFDNERGAETALSTLTTDDCEAVEVGMSICVDVTLGEVEYIGSGKRSAFADA